MTINEVMLRYNFISKVQFKDGDSSLDKDLKVKVMDMRIEFGKIKKQLEADLKEFVDGLASEEMKQLSGKADKTAEEEKQLEDYNKQINDDYNTYLKKRGMEDVTVKETSITEDEFEQIVATNSGTDPAINGQTILAPDFLEIIHELFVV